ncbi:MAG: protein-disulfide reductase DsbD domain-containing protein [Pseudomonadota bacterium]
MATALATAPEARPTGENGDVVAVEVLPGWRTGPDTHVAALRITLAHGWKTYWRAPGDAGIPAAFDWQMSTNLAGVKTHWPVPAIFVQNGMRSIGYENEVIIPLNLELASSGAATRLVGDIELGVCEEICIPAFVFVDAKLPARGTHDPDIAAALADRPLTEREAAVSHVTCAVEPISDGLSLTVRATMPPIARGEAAAIETADPTVWVAEPRVTRDGDMLTARTELVRYDAMPFALDRSGVRMTVFGAGRAVDIRGCVGE